MPQGVAVYDSAGVLLFDGTKRLQRVIYAGPASSSGVPNNAWHTVIASTYPGLVWGVMIPLYPVDTTTPSDIEKKQADVSVDHAGRPGQIYISGNWFDPVAGVTTDYFYQNSILIYGVY